ncbi:DUF4383 domain-containing protein [Mycobacterium paraterrae]|uniref:DUF4383 domain-containing protein n=1 Tax=Mycobacterium paraterrae TaxID=577492 RepID=A0ABY3VP10_9MYCO|nr:DUF4383 domain-containing protein [Mycobacterium paraterrae]UMB68942.1 DUF4383 domain-containing protein [Mycobacterium paraterrae]
MTDNIDAESRAAQLRWAPVQISALVVGVVFLLVGILGFIPGITTHYAMLTAAGPHSGAELFGLFNVSILHNIVHLAFGVAGLALSRNAMAARAFLIIGGAIYVVLWIYGLVINQNKPINFVPVNTGDNWLHFALGAGMLALGVLFGRPQALASSRRDDVRRIGT